MHNEDVETHPEDVDGSIQQHLLVGIDVLGGLFCALSLFGCELLLGQNRRLLLAADEDGGSECGRGGGASATLHVCAGTEQTYQQTCCAATLSATRL